MSRALPDGREERRSVPTNSLNKKRPPPADRWAPKNGVQRHRRRVLSPAAGAFPGSVFRAAA